jgi:hypothetical protein
MERLTASPMPIPCGFVVKNASNTRSTAAGSSPEPESATVTRTPSGPWLLDRMTRRRGPSAVLPIASMPFMMRLSAICWSWTRSPSTRGTAVERSVSIETRPLWASARVRATASRNTSFTSSASFRHRNFRVDARTRSMIAAARVAPAMMRVVA